MTTYQDLLKVKNSDAERMAFVKGAINKYKSSGFYKTAEIAEKYDRRENPDIAAFTKWLYTASGRKIPDTYSSNYRLGRGFFPFFVTQEVQYLLSNGVSWGDVGTRDKLGTDKAPFDTRLQEIAHAAVCHGCAYGFWNLDHVDVFTALEFVPLYDEETGALRAGIRWWRLAADKPLRATLYEEDGYTDYSWDSKAGAGWDGTVIHEKRPYKISVAKSDVDKDAIYTGDNYPSFPIVPMWGNKKHLSEIVGLREQIFAYDVIRSGFCDTVEESSYVFWAISNAPGMTMEDMAEFLRGVKELHVGVTVDGQGSAEPRTIETPYAARAELLSQLERNIYDDAMAFNPDRVIGGASTATQIKASYNKLDAKVNGFEFCVLQFIKGILRLAGVDDDATFTRDVTVNVAEEIQSIIAGASALSEEYVTKKILTLLGDGDQAEEVLAQIDKGESGRWESIEV